MTQRDSHGRFIKAMVPGLDSSKISSGTLSVDQLNVVTKGLSLDQWTAYRDASTALDRAVAQAESDVRRYDAVS